MNGRSFSLGLCLSIAIAGSAALVNCAAPTEESDAELSEDQLTGINNALGLRVRYVEATGTIEATLPKPLAENERLFVRVRRGKLTLTSQKELDCGELMKATTGKATEGAPPSARMVGVGRRLPSGKVAYAGPKVDKAVFDLVHIFDDARWATGDVPRALQDEVQRLGADPIVEACVMKGDKPRAKLQTNLAYAWDMATRDDATGPKTQGLRIQGTDAGIGDDAGDDGGDAGDAGGGQVEGINETNVHSQIEYGELCVQQLGEIPFFKKLGSGKYETFDCRDLVGTNAEGPTGGIDGVEGSHIPVTVDGVEQDNCSPGRELGLSDSSYGCMDKADHGMFLATGEVQPGPMVLSARNAEGTHWVLLCRKVSDDGSGMRRTKVFNDIAMIGHNPQTGRTCFFQNSIGSGRDGQHVPHPADVEKSTTVWSSNVQSYCSGQCHAESAFVHSPWIDGAKRSTGHAIVPKAGEHADFPISRLDAPYNIVAADHLGFSIPKQLVSDEVGPCNNCHRLAGNTMRSFARWATGTGDDYYARITETGKKFESSHWMPARLEGLSESNWEASRFGAALKVMRTCEQNANDPLCLWADVPRGAFDNPRLR